MRSRARPIRWILTGWSASPRRAAATPIWSRALFRAYFLDGVDIGEIDALIRIAVTGGYDGAEVRRYLASDEACNEVTAEDFRARRMGIEGVPCFIVNDRYAVAGAQDPEVFFPLLDVAVLEAAGEPVVGVPSLA